MLRRTLLGMAPALAQTIPDRGPQLPSELVKEFVVAAHASLEKTKELLARQPSLVHACWDWGGGDFETGLGGASHMGNRDIAQFLLAQGARMDLFAAAMLGRLEIVKAALAAFPEQAAALGPHKIPLIAHAKRGGAEDVVRYLEEFKRP
jgi:hypothetical protein